MYSFRERSSEIELMDRPDADETKLLRTVRQFRTINFLFSRSRSLLRRYVLDRVAARQQEEVTFLDIGAGGCEIAAWLARRLRRMGKRATLICLDADPRIARMAARRYRHIDELRVVTGTLSDLPSNFRVDYAFSNHTLHHLTSAQIVELLSWLQDHVDEHFVMNDLHRSPLSHLMFTIAAGLLFHGSFSFTDGRMSIRRGFKAAELEALIRRSHRTYDIKVKTLFPGRVAVLGTRDAGG